MEQVRVELRPFANLCQKVNIASVNGTQQSELVWSLMLSPLHTHGKSSSFTFFRLLSLRRKAATASVLIPPPKL